MPAVIPVVAAVAGGFIANKGSRDAAAAQTLSQDKAIEAAKMDPRLERLLYGNGTPENQGLLGKYIASGNAPQLSGLRDYGTAQDAYIGQNGISDLAAMRGAANNLMGSNISAPQMQAAQMQTTINGPAAQASANIAGKGLLSQAAESSQSPAVTPYSSQVLWNSGENYSAPSAMRAAQVGAPQQVSGQQVGTVNAGVTNINAPSQNDLDLSGSYSRFINSNPGENQFLKRATEGAIASNRLGFQQMLDDSTRNMNENVLGGIRSNAILSGQYGGSRQGIAEGRAIGDMAREQARAAAMFGQNATNASVGAQAGAYETDSNRALSATQGLGAQQYGVAQQDASAENQARLANAGAANSAMQATAGFGQQAALANQSSGLQAGTTNANLLQQSNLNNYQGELSATAGSAENRQQANLANQNAGNAASTFNAGQAQNASLQNANLTQNNNQFNAGQQNNMSQYNAGQLNNMAQYNTGLQQQNNQFNTSALNQGNQYNAGLSQQSGLANQQSQQDVNRLNSQNQLAGLGANSGLLGTALQGAQNQDNYGMNRNSQMLGLIGNLANRQSNPVAQPVYGNTAGNTMQGILGGLSLGNQIGGLFGASNQPYGGAVGDSSKPYGYGGVF